MLPDISKDHIAFICLECWNLENEGTMILQNVRNLLLTDTHIAEDLSPTVILHLVTGLHLEGLPDISHGWL